MIYAQLKENLFNKIEELAPEIYALNDQLADEPELGNEEYKSSAALADLLSRHGVEVEKPFAGMPTAFRAGFNGKQNGDQKVALLAEYDALPGIGHACGHNVSGSISVLTGLALFKLTHTFGGRVDIIGTPAEESAGGKVKMTEQGIFKEYDLAMMIHLDSRNRCNSCFLALDGLAFTFSGQASHAAAAPWEGRNALNGVQLMFHAIDMLRQHLKDDVRIHGIIADGGEACNIVPEKAEAHFFIRAREREYLDRVKEMVLDCAKGAAIATQTEVETGSLCPTLSDLKPNQAGDDLMAECFREIGIPDLREEYGTGSSDIGSTSYQCPTLHPRLAIAETGARLHTREFARFVKGEHAHQAILKGAKILSLACLKFFHDRELAEQVRQDFLG